MKTLTTMTAVAALIAGISFASAQMNNTPPSGINPGAEPATASGSKATNPSGGAMIDKSAKLTGTGKFCLGGGQANKPWNCSYATLAACTKVAQPEGSQCSPRPAVTTGSNSKM